MRILVISDLPQFVTGGAEMQAMRLIEAWAAAGHEISCFGRRMGTTPVVAAGRTIETRRIRTLDLFGRPGRAASYFVSLAWLLLGVRRRTDIVYTRFLGEAASTAAILKAMRLLHVPLVATPANTHGNGDTNLLRQLSGGRHLVKLLDRHCDAINLIAADMAPELKAAGFGGDNFTHVPNGIALAPLASRAPRARRVRFVAVGRLAPQKGYDLLLHAVAEVRESIDAGQIRIIGDGPERSRLIELASRLDIADRIQWLGELPQTEVQRVLDAADVFLLPSRYEGLSNAGIEALARGLPVLASRCGGLDHYLDADTGWTVPVGDVGALAEALRSSASMDAQRLERMTAAARRLAERHFDMRSVAVQYLDIFEACRLKLGRASTDAR